MQVKNDKISKKKIGCFKIQEVSNVKKVFLAGIKKSAFIMPIRKKDYPINVRTIPTKSGIEILSSIFILSSKTSAKTAAIQAKTLT